MKEFVIPVSVGEMLDKISILCIKLVKINDVEKREHVTHELNALMLVLGDATPYGAYLDKFREINGQIWDATDCMINGHEDDFEAAASTAYYVNRERFALKDKANKEFNSALREVKSHQ